ncbi:MAG: GGDEF domain-containing protein [Clostridia bacterium]|nr:GGDEF domain-containing protein [Clostridia bacterium]
MTYSTTGLLALLVHLIINYDVIRNVHYRKGFPDADAYRGMILAVAMFYITDILWGVFYDAHLVTLTFADTVLYFIAMAATVFMWTRYVFLYLKLNGRFMQVLSVAGWMFLILVGLVLFLNIFAPLMFWFDPAGNYHAGLMRYFLLGFQILLFMATSIYVFIVSRKADKAVKYHYKAIGMFGVTMTVMVILQVLYPLLPMYSMGCLLSVSILHTFVVGDMKEDRRRELEEMLAREQRQKVELGSARHLAYTDSLTGVKNTHAYVETERHLDERIAGGTIREFGVVVFDMNGLKQVNDTLGHEAGDKYIQDACRMICRQFQHSPVYRIGGDEFVVLLEGEDYRNRTILMSAFETHVEMNVHCGDAVVASGLAEFRPGQDNSYRRVFERADRRMYERKSILKAM